MSCFKDRRNSTTDHDDMRNSADQDTDPDCFVSSKLRISYPTTKYRDHVRQEQEDKSQGDRELYAAS